MNESRSEAGGGRPADAPALVEIIDVLRPQLEKIEDGFKAILETMDGLSEHMRGGSGGAVSMPQAAVREAAPPEAASSPTTESPVQEEEPAILPPAAAPAPVAQPAPATPKPARNTAPEPAPVAPPTRAEAASDWSRILFGEFLDVKSSIAGLSGALLADVYAGDEEAVSMAGHLLIFRTASADRMAKMLKDLGEAFYRWKPAGDSVLLNALLAWVMACIADRGLQNTIDIVQPGDRFDMARHNAKERGVEVSDVFGWVVLRDNGKVYSKANVSVK